jgi:hypothetical protein
LLTLLFLEVSADCRRASVAQLVDTRAQTIVWRHSETAGEPVLRRDVAGVVGSLSAATRRAIAALMASLESDVALGTRW